MVTFEENVEDLNLVGDPIVPPDESFYVTTPIYYPNIGHAYTTIIADIISRYHRLFGQETFFITGTDEHGQKVQQEAEKQGVTPQELVDRVSLEFQQSWKSFSVEPDLFMRTTYDYHESLVSKCLAKLYDKGEIYKAEYTGWYCVSEEIFYTEKDLVDGKSPTGKEVVEVAETAYFFRMSRYQQRLIQYIKNHPEFIAPNEKRQEVLGFLENELKDLCVSRPKSRVSWGIELPFDQDYVAYVWFDALLNYVSAIDQGKIVGSSRFERFWKQANHLIGKDILITHAVYWPTMLMALELPLPRKIFAHGWWLNSEGKKMSKSEGDVVAPSNMKTIFGEDVFRYYMARGLKFGNDLAFDINKAKAKVNEELANHYGNLISRTINFVVKNFDKKIPLGSLNDVDTQTLAKSALKVAGRVYERIEELNIDGAVGETVSFITEINRYIDNKAPWSLVKRNNLEDAGVALYASIEALRIATILLHPVMPQTTEKLLGILGFTSSHLCIENALKWGQLVVGREVKKISPFFVRLN